MKKNKLLLLLLSFALSLIISGTSFATNHSFIAFPNPNQDYFYPKDDFDLDSTAAFSTAFSILKNKQLDAESVNAFIKSQNYQPSTIIKQLASRSNLTYSTLHHELNNSLIVDILKNLHDNKIILAYASGSAPFSYDGNFVVIYSASSNGYFGISVPKNENYRGKFFNYKSFVSSIKSNANFYVVGEAK